MPFRPTTGLRANPDFMRLWAAQAVSAVGSRLTRTALPVIAILALGAGPEGVAWLAALGVAPAILVGLLAGGFVDRNHKRPLLIAADLARAALVLSVPLAAWWGGLTLAHLYVVAALAGAATALFQIADNAFLPALVGKDRLVDANSRIEATEATAEIAGPALAGILIRTLTAPVTMVLDALSYLWSAALLARIRTREALAPPSRAQGAVARLLDDLRLGRTHGARHPVVGPTFAAYGMQAFFGGFFFALYMLYTLRTLALDEATVGIVIAMGGVGALFGSLLARRLAAVIGTGPAMVATLTVAQAAALLIPAAGQAGQFQIPLLVLHQLLGDGMMVAFVILAVSLRQTLLPTEVLGRVNATFQVLTGVMLPLGTVTAGLVADRIGVEGAIWLGVIGGLAAPMVLLRPAVLRLRKVEVPA